MPSALLGVGRDDKADNGPLCFGEKLWGGGAKKAQDSIAINSQFPASSGTAGGGIEFQAFSIPPVL